MTGGGRRSVVDRWVAGTAVAGTVVIAAAAFWLSFTALTDLVRRSGVPGGQAWAWPLIVDGIIVVATVAVVALPRRRAWYPWLLLACATAMSVAANAVHARLTATSGVPGGLAACVAGVPPVVLLAITHLTVLLTHPTSVHGLPPTTVVDGTPSGAPAGAGAGLAVGTPDVCDASAVPGRRVEAAGLRRQGWSNRQIARHLGVHPSTVGRWFHPMTPSGIPDEHTGKEILP